MEFLLLSIIRDGLPKLGLQLESSLVVSGCAPASNAHAVSALHPQKCNLHYAMPQKGRPGSRLGLQPGNGGSNREIHFSILTTLFLRDDMALATWQARGPRLRAWFRACAFPRAILFGGANYFERSLTSRRVNSARRREGAESEVCFVNAEKVLRSWPNGLPPALREPPRFRGRPLTESVKYEPSSNTGPFFGCSTRCMVSGEVREEQLTRTRVFWHPCERVAVSSILRTHRAI
jgi:hypothetical protein